MLKKILVLTLLFSVSVTTPHIARCDDFRVVTIDVNKLINNLPESKQKKAELDKIREASKKTIDSKREKLKDLEKKFKASKKGTDSAEADALRKAIRDYEQTAAQLQEDFNKKFMTVNKELTRKVLTVVEKYAKSHKISLVLDKGTTGTSPLLYGDEAVDITNIIAKELKE